MTRNEQVQYLSQRFAMEQADHGWLRYRDYDVWLDLPQERHLLIVIAAIPRQRLLVSPKSAVTRELDALGLAGRIQTELPDFDDRYVVRTDGDAAEAALIVRGIVEPVEKLEPLVELEMTAREYRLLKRPPESLETVMSDLDALIDIVLVTRARSRA